MRALEDYLFDIALDSAGVQSGDGQVHRSRHAARAAQERDADRSGISTISREVRSDSSTISHPRAASPALADEDLQNEEELTKGGPAHTANGPRGGRRRCR